MSIVYKSDKPEAVYLTPDEVDSNFRELSNHIALLLTGVIKKNEDGLFVNSTFPTSDPSVNGALWNDSGFLKISEVQEEPS